MQHVSVDLETLSTCKRAAILSIGAVRFEPLGSMVPSGVSNTFYKNVDLQSCLDFGLEPDGKTFYWWLQQSTTARQALSQPPPVALDEALLAFAMWLRNTTRYLGTDNDDQTIYWCHENFDAPVLEEAFRACKLTLPWSRRDWRDIRTLLDCADGFAYQGKPSILTTVERTETEHDALADATYQARVIQAAFKATYKLVAATSLSA